MKFPGSYAVISKRKPKEESQRLDFSKIRSKHHTKNLQNCVPYHSCLQKEQPGENGDDGHDSAARRIADGQWL